ncbi:MAG TPA: hypothetical protein VFO73_05300 [Candidatus Limnocylindrales bacterium]|nr:hypothetical protein [Candidatus Limnocylindrales bacterium]
MDTFLLRIWTPSDAAGATEVATGARGTAHHVGTGRTGIFRSEAQLLRLLHELRKAATEPDPAAPLGAIEPTTATDELALP